MQYKRVYFKHHYQVDRDIEKAKAIHRDIKHF
jgi:hypothetical protein